MNDQKFSDAAILMIKYIVSEYEEAFLFSKIGNELKRDFVGTTLGHIICHMAFSVAHKEAPLDQLTRFVDDIASIAKREITKKRGSHEPTNRNNS